MEGLGVEAEAEAEGEEVGLGEAVDWFILAPGAPILARLRTFAAGESFSIDLAGEGLLIDGGETSLLARETDAAVGRVNEDEGRDLGVDAGSEALGTGEAEGFEIADSLGFATALRGIGEAVDSDREANLRELGESSGLAGDDLFPPLAVAETVVRVVFGDTPNRVLRKFVVGETTLAFKADTAVLGLLVEVFSEAALRETTVLFFGVSVACTEGLGTAEGASAAA